MNRMVHVFGRMHVLQAKAPFHKNITAIHLGIASHQHVVEAKNNKIYPNKAVSCFWYSTSTPLLLRLPGNSREDSQGPAIYEENVPSPSESEQEIRRIQSIVQTGSEESYNKTLKALYSATEKLRLLESKDGIGQEALVKAMKDVASIQWDLGMLNEAQSTQEEILSKLIAMYSPKAQKATEPPKHMEIASTMHTIGSIQSRMNNPDEAKKWFDASLSIKEELLFNFTHHFEIGKTLNGLALVKMQLDEENDGESDPFDVIQMLDEAESHYIYHGTKHDSSKEGSESAQENNEDFADHLQVASINENIATLYRKHGDLKMALGRYENALRIYRQHYNVECDLQKGKEQIINLIIDCGDCLSGLEKYDEALKRYEEALKLHILLVKHQGKHHSKSVDCDKELHPKNMAVVTPLVGVLKHNIGMMYAYLGNYEEATSEYLNALSIKKSFGEHHPQVGITFNAIGAMEGARGDTDSALNYFEKALEIFRMHTSAVDDEDQDENIYCTKQNVERVQRSLGGIGRRYDSIGRSRGSNF